MKILQNKLRRLKIVITVFQTVFVLMLFFPVAKGIAGAALNSVELAQRYAGIGYLVGSAFYLISVVFAPAVAILAIWSVKQRQNGFAAAACLTAYTELVQLCFYTASQTALSDSVQFTGTYLFICLFILFGMFVCIHAYLCAAPPHRPTRKP